MCFQKSQNSSSRLNLTGSLLHQVQQLACAVVWLTIKRDSNGRYMYEYNCSTFTRGLQGAHPRGRHLSLRHHAVPASRSQLKYYAGYIQREYCASGWLISFILQGLTYSKLWFGSRTQDLHPTHIWAQRKELLPSPQMNLYLLCK